MPQKQNSPSPKIVVIGGGTAGIGVIAGIRKRIRHAEITVIEPGENHYYQPGWTLAGAGLYDEKKTIRPMRQVLPPAVNWVQEAVTGITASGKFLTTRSGRKINYDFLVIACGVTLRWDKIEGLTETLGQNGVTSNYMPGLAGYTWQLVKQLNRGTALFCQPVTPFKCAGAPQKALYLSAEHWQKKGVLKDIEIIFNVAGNAIFSVPYFIPVLKSYLQRYTATVSYSSNLIKVDGNKKLATFRVTGQGEPDREVVYPFDMLHVVPPQTPPGFIAESGLANTGGWCDVDPATLQHNTYPDIFALGDCSSAPASKTAAAARKQMVVVAENLRDVIHGSAPKTHYDGYGSCPLTVERGRVVLAEYGYQNKLLPTFPGEPARASRFAWFLTARFLPVFYWHGILKGVEWFARSKTSDK